MDNVSALALRESEELHRITLLSMSDAVFITDDHGAFTFVCPNADVIFGYNHDEVEAMGCIARLLGRELIHPPDLAARGEVRNLEHPIATKRGERRDLLIHVKQVSIGRGTILYVCRDVTERKQAEQALRRNEERLNLALEAASMGTWDWDLPTGEMTWSPETHLMLGDTARFRQPSFDAFLDRVHAADRDRVARNMALAMERGTSYETDFRAVGYDGVERWILSKGRVLRNGKPLRMLGVFVDVTDRVHADQDLRELGGQLINAHEQERIRLARELHDEFGQRIALLATELALLRQDLPGGAKDLHDQVTKIAMDAADIGGAVHRLSHNLHPSRLEHLGLQTSIRTLCHEVEDARHLHIDLEIDDVPESIREDTALCLYRIAQEALHNVVKHSGASHAVLGLGRHARDIVMSVTDDGAGFDPAAVRRKGTLGLISMRERARLVQATLAVTSQPGHGTRLEVRAPLARG